MKQIKPAAFSVVSDSKTGQTTLIPNPTAKSIEYTDTELKTLMDLKLLPPQLGKAGLDLLAEIKRELNNHIKFKAKYPNPTQEDYFKWYQENHTAKVDINKVNAGINLLNFILENEEKLKRALEKNVSDPQTFAIPSQEIMFSLLAMFAGKPQRIPRKLLEKPLNQRTTEEQKEAEEYLRTIFQESFNYGNGQEEKELIALICENPKIEAQAKIEMSLFRHDALFREEKLALYIKKTFGAEGMRHLLGLIIGLEENFRKGHFAWSVNDHLERLGYKKQPNRTFDPELKRTASEIIKIFTGLCITSTKKEGKKGSIKGQFLFMVSGFEAQTFKNEIIDERINLVATDFWYSNAFYKDEKKAPRYTKLLKEIAKENHQQHPLTIYLAPLLAIFWRINPERKFKVKHLMEWCDLEVDGKYKSENFRNLISELNYMKGKNYLGDWKLEDFSNSLSDNINDHYERVIHLTPPEWLQNELILIKQKREIPAVTLKKEVLSLQEFKTILDESGMSRQKFSQAIGVTPQLIAAILNGKRKITPETTRKIDSYKQRKNTTKEYKQN